MIRLVKFTLDYAEEYLQMYREWLASGTALIPDVLELKCTSKEDYIDILKELKNREAGMHEDLDWYEKGYYFLALNEDNTLVGVGCIRYNLTQLGSDIWGHIASGVRPSERKKGYATQIIKALIEKCADMQMEEVILCHYIDNEITPKILAKIGAEYTNSVVSKFTDREIKRYVYKIRK